MNQAPKHEQTAHFPPRPAPNSLITVPENLDRAMLVPNPLWSWLNQSRQECVAGETFFFFFRFVYLFFWSKPELALRSFFDIFSGSVFSHIHKAFLLPLVGF